MTQTTDQPSALDTQIGGSHYKDMAIQPMEFSMANGLDACQHTIIKYVSRFRDKNGVEDLHKAKHVIDMLIEFETSGDAEPTPKADDEDIAENPFIKAFFGGLKSAIEAETKTNSETAPKQPIDQEVTDALNTLFAAGVIKHV